MALSRFFLAILAAQLSSDLCAASSGASRVFFFSDSNEIFRSRDQDAAIPSISPLALAASSAALMGLPSPPGTDSAASKEIKELLTPIPFLRAPVLVVLAVHSASSIPEEWAAPVSLGHKAAGLHVVQRRSLPAHGVDVLRAELGAVKRESGAGLRLIPGDEAQLPPINLEDAKETWDAAVLGASTLGNMDSHSSYAILASFGKSGEEYLRSVVQLSRLIDAASSAGTSSSPVLVAANLSLKELEVEADEEESVPEALEAALAVLASSALKAKKADAPVALTLVLDPSPLGKHSGLGLLPPSATGSSGEWSEQRRALTTTTDEETETPQETINKTVYFVVWIVLLSAFIVGLCLMCGMPVTKDTLLYSGAKVD